MFNQDVVAASPLVEVADLDLVERTRDGDRDAFGELWRRHSAAGYAVARSYTTEPDDILAESFARILTAIRAGRGPRTAFRAYLFTTIRSAAYQSRRGAGTDTVDDFDRFVDVRSEESAHGEALDRSLTIEAFRSLPPRWQEALWYSEVEQLTSAEIAPLLGVKANAVNALTFRAREGLRQAWIQVHLQRAREGECTAVIERLGSYARGALGQREANRVREHLHACASCTKVADEAHDVNAKLALVLLPLAAGLAGAAGYTAWRGSDSSAHAITSASASAPGAGAGTNPGTSGTVRTLSTAKGIGAWGVAAAVTIGVAAATASLVVPWVAATASSGHNAAAEATVDPAANTASTTVPFAPRSLTTVPRPAASPAPTPASGTDAPATDPTPGTNPIAPAPPIDTQDFPPNSGTPTPPPVLTPPPVPSAIVLPDPSGLYYPLVHGTAEPDALVELVDAQGVGLTQGRADHSGAFALTDLSSLGFGTTLVGVREIRDDGVASAPSALTAVVLQPFTMTTPMDGATVAPPGFVLEGSGVPDQHVLIETPSATLVPHIATTNHDGTLSEDVDLNADQIGALTLSVCYFDEVTGRRGPAAIVHLHVVPTLP